MTQTIYTIGHSNHSIEHFAVLLEMHGITALCDVRSKPYSRLNPQFNRKILNNGLRKSGIAYVFLGLELGARSEDQACYQNGRVKYELLAQTKLFRDGIERIQGGIQKQYHLALMCAEKDPIECHRTILVSRELQAIGFEIRHILADGRVETHGQTMGRLMRMLGLAADDLFRSRDMVEAEAYRIQGERIAYTKDDPFLEGEREVAG
jgi:uncharacterized protein (DUF488 family)